MREIKFRGKVFGTWEHAAFDDDHWERFWALVDHETVGQYVGIKDKHGQEIFENDILRWIEPDNRGLGHLDAIGMVAYRQTITAFGLGHHCTALNAYQDLEVIGNWHDNPDLLKISHD